MVRPPDELEAALNLSFIVGGLIAIALAAALSLYLSHRIASPLAALTAATTHTAAGDYSHRVIATGGREIEELGEAFNTLAANLELNEELRRNMVADVAHELRTPLSVIGSHLEAMAEGVVEPDAAAIASLREEVEVLSRLVQDLSQLAAVEAGQLKIEPAPLNALEVLSSTRVKFGPELEARGLTMRVSAQEGTPEVRADPARLSQILSVLVSNAITHSDAGGVISIIAAGEGEGTRVRFSVADTGAGIPQAELPFVFERFYRADRSRDRATGGAGLGLTIAKGLVEAHGGTIEAESEAGKGTVIRFALPAAGTDG